MTLKKFPCGHRRIKSNLTKRKTCRICVIARVVAYQKLYPEKVRANNVACRLRNPKRYWERKRRWKHGPNAVDHYETQRKKQRGKCVLCFKKKNLVQDHDHGCCPRTKKNSRSCGKCLRGLLCHSCNRRLGTLELLFLLNPNMKIPEKNLWVERAFQYVFEWKTKT